MLAPVIENFVDAALSQGANLSTATRSGILVPLAKRNKPKEAHQYHNTYRRETFYRNRSGRDECQDDQQQCRKRENSELLAILPLD